MSAVKYKNWIIISVLFSICCLFSCQKDTENPLAPTPSLEKVSSIHGLKGGLDEYKEEYHYNDNILSEYYIYRPAKEGEWKNWLRFSYEYPSDDFIVETREGFADSVWFPANKNEKMFHGEDLEQITQYDYDEGFPGNWRPVRKLKWTFIGDRLVERMTYTWPDGGWKEYIKSVYEYTGSLWTGMRSLKNNNGLWDTIGCVSLIYKEGILDEVMVFECQELGNWKLNEQYILQYNGNQLQEMVINVSSGDSLVWERTLFVTYNANGNPASYTIDYACCPTEEVFMTYKDGKGNFQKATQGYSNYMLWPWFPAPVK